MRLLLLLLIPLLVHAQTTVVGSVKIASGATILRGSDTLPAGQGVHLQPHDVLRTSPEGSLGIILQDGTRVSLGPNTSVEIDRFAYEPAQGNFALVLKMVRGVISYVSGKIAQFSPGAVKVETPVGVVGMRGTEMAISLDEGASK